MMQWLDVESVGQNRTTRLRPGESLSFGRRPLPDSTRQLVLTNDERMSRTAGVIVAAENSWIVQNLSRFVPLRVVDLDGSGFHELEPRSAAHPTLERRDSASIAWNHARLELMLTATERIELAVRARFDAAESSTWANTITTVRASDLDKDRLYFVTLLALCEARLRDASEMVLLNDDQVAARLINSGADPGATPKMVERRLARARDRLGLQAMRDAAPEIALSSLRHLLVDTAIACGVVTRADLAASPLNHETSRP